MIILRECIVAHEEKGNWPKGTIMPWPADMPLLPGFIWLREEIMIAGSNGEAISTWGDLTPEARKVFREIENQSKDLRK